jgi:hypothetical protein
MTVRSEGEAMGHQMELFAKSSGKRTATGIATSKVTVSSHQGGNEDLFPQILHLHVPDGATVADVTFGQGVFWKKRWTGRVIA